MLSQGTYWFLHLGCIVAILLLMRGTRENRETWCQLLSENIVKFPDKWATHVHAHTHTICTHTQSYSHSHTHTSLHMKTHIYTQSHIDTWIHTHTVIHSHAVIYTHSHTHSHNMHTHNTVPHAVTCTHKHTPSHTHPLSSSSLYLWHPNMINTPGSPPQLVTLAHSYFSNLICTSGD